MNFLKHRSSFSVIAVMTGLLLILVHFMDRRDQHPPSGRKVIHYMSMYANGEPFQQMLQQAFLEFEKLHPEYQVKAAWEGRWNVSKARTRLLVNNPPDLIDQAKHELAPLRTTGLLVPLDEHLAKLPALNHPLGNISWGESFIPNFLEAFREHDGRIYVIPREAYSAILFCNQALLDRVNAKPPRTLQEWLQTNQKLKEAGITPIGMDGSVYKEAYFEYLCLRYMGRKEYIASLLGKGRPWNDPIYIKAMKTLVELRRSFDVNFRGYLWPAAQREWANAAKTCFFANGTWLPNEIRSYQNMDPKIFRPVAIPFPIDDESPANQKLIAMVPYGFCIPKGSANPEGAIELLRYVSSYPVTSRFVQELNLIPTLKSIPFPQELSGIETALQEATEIHSEGSRSLAPAWCKYVLDDLFLKFFLDLEETISPEQFCEELQKRTVAWRKSENPGGGR